MLKKLKGVLLLFSFLFLILAGTLVYLSAERVTCEDKGCKGQSFCDQGVDEWKGCTKDNPCIGGGSMKCEAPYPI